MRLRYMLSRVWFSVFIVVALACPLVSGQSLKPIPDAPPAKEPPQANQNNFPFKMTSRIHLQKGSNKGYVVLRVELEKGNYIYSLNQSGGIRPTQIKAADSKVFRLTGKFSSDRPATIIENDPVFNQRIEKHKGVIQFFAPIQFASNVDFDKWSTELVVEGQVCQETGFCMPISGLKVKSRFAGYFDRTAEKRESSQSSTGQGKLRR